MASIIKSEVDIQKYLSEKKSIIDNKLNKIFLKNNNFTEPKELWNAVRYSLLDSGKRIRGILCIASYESLKNNQIEPLDDILVVASSLEIIHAMSLIHDDLPSMDNDDLRRGKPSCHKAFGESTAILAGDAMLSIAPYLIIEECKTTSDAKKLALINLFAKTISFGLVPGQVLDLSILNKKSNINLLEQIYTLKTADLIKTSIISGAILAFEPNNLNNEKIIKELASIGTKIGTAFQIIDDVLDVTSDTKILGKTSHKDEKRKKPTFPMIIGVEKSKETATNLIREAKDELRKLPLKSPVIPMLGDYIINRIN